MLQPNAEKVTVPQGEIDTIVPNKKSAMPEGLFNTLILAEIAVIRKEGIAYDTEEYMPGLCCMAAPIKDFSSRTIAAMSLSMFKHKMKGERRAYFKEALFRASSEVSEKMGYSGALKRMAI